MDSTSPEPPTDPQQASLLKRARQGCGSALGELLEVHRKYLLLVASQELAVELRAKVGPSDLVQETLLEAHRDFRRTQHASPSKLKSWLRRILLNNLANLNRRFQAGKRQLNRERLLGDWSIDAELEYRLEGSTTSPSGKAILNEERERLEQLILRLPKDYRQVLRLRHQFGFSFPEIGRRMDRSPDAARMLWWRAFEQLAGLLEPGNEHE